MSEKKSSIALVLPNSQNEKGDEFAQIKKRIQAAQLHLSESKMRMKLHNMTTSSSTDTFAINDTPSGVPEGVLDNRTSISDVQRKKMERCASTLSIKDDKSQDMMRTTEDNNRKDSLFWKKKVIELERENRERSEKIKELEKQNRFSAEKRKVNSNCKLNKLTSVKDMKKLVRVSSEKGSSHQLKREFSRNNLFYEYASIKESNSTLKAKLSRVESELHNQRKSLEDLHGKKKQLDRKVQNLTHDKKTISCDYMQLKKDFEDKLSEQRKIFEKQFKTELQESNKKITSLKTELELVGKERDEAAHSLKCNEVSYRQKIDELQTKLNSAQDERNSALVSLECNEASYRQKIDELQTKLNSAQDERNSALVSLECNEASYRQKIDELQTKLNSVEGECSKAVTSLKHSSKCSEEKIACLQNKLNLVKNERSSLKSNEDSCRHRMNDLQNELSANKEERRKAVTSLKNIEKSSQMKIKDSQQKINDLENKIVSLKGDLEDTINESNVQIEQLRNAIDIAYIERSTVVIEYEDYKKNTEQKLIGYDEAKSRAENLMCINKSLQKDLNYVHENYKKSDAQLKLARSNTKEVDEHRVAINKLKELKKVLLEQVQELEVEKSRGENELKAKLELHLIEMNKKTNADKQLESANMGVFSTSSCNQRELEELKQCKTKITGLKSKLQNERQNRLHDRELFKNILRKNQKIFDDLDKNLQKEIKKSETLKEKITEMEGLLNSQQQMVKKTYNTHIEVAALKRERDNLRKQIHAGNYKLELEIKDLKAECESLQSLLDMRNKPDAVFEGLPNVKNKNMIKNNDNMTSKSAEDIIKLNKENTNSRIKDERLGQQKKNRKFGSSLKLMPSCLEEENEDMASKIAEDTIKGNDENINSSLKDERLGQQKRNRKFGSTLRLMPSCLEEENE